MNKGKVATIPGCKGFVLWDLGSRFLKCQWGPPPELKDLGKLELQPENQGEIIMRCIWCVSICIH